VCGAWRQGMFRQVTDPETVGLSGAWRLAASENRQAVCTGFAWRPLGCARR